MAQTTNALDILIGALPTDVASSIAQQFSISIPQPTSVSTSASTTPSQSSSTVASTSSSSTKSSSSSSSSTLLTSTTSAQSSASSTSSANVTSQTTAAPVATTSQNQLSGGAIAGIAVGCIIGGALIFLLLLLFLRRRNSRNSGSDSGRSSLLGSLGRRKEKVYPEVAWLYDPVRPMSRDGRASQDPLRPSQDPLRSSQDPLRSPGLPRPSNDSAPRMGANAPWSSRPSTSTEQGLVHPASPGMLPVPTQTSPLGPSMFQPPRDRSMSNPRYYSPTMAHEEPQEDVVSPLLPPPVQPSGRFGRMAAGYDQSPYRSHNASPAPEHMTPMMSSVGFSPYNPGRPF